jgi:DNA-binding CsgD family transcriptional regulator
VAITYTPRMIRRDEKILAWYKAGKTYAWISNKTGLCTARIYQILSNTGAKRAA